MSHVSRPRHKLSAVGRASHGHLCSGQSNVSGLYRDTPLDLRLVLMAAGGARWFYNKYRCGAPPVCRPSSEKGVCASLLKRGDFLLRGAIVAGFSCTGSSKITAEMCLCGLRACVVGLRVSMVLYCGLCSTSSVTSHPSLSLLVPSPSLSIRFILPLYSLSPSLSHSLPPIPPLPFFSSLLSLGPCVLRQQGRALPRRRAILHSEEGYDAPHVVGRRGQSRS